MLARMSMRATVHRRTVVFGLVGGVVASLIPARARAATTRVLVLGGSSMVGALGKLLAEGLRDAGYVVERKAKSASGLARPDFYDWPSAAAEAYAAFRPDATVVMFGGNDGQGLRMPDDADVEWIRWTDAGWAEEYRRRVTAVSDAVAPAGEHVFWIGMPPMRQSKLDARMQRINAILETTMAARENGHFIASQPVLGGKDGGYTEHLRIDGEQVRVRASDGIHVNRAGAQHLADGVVPSVREHLDPST